MKDLIIGDIHTEEVSSLIFVIEEEEIGRIMFLGDVEMPSLLRELRNLGVPVLYCPGNHEEAYVTGGTQIIPYLLAPDPFEYKKEWDSPEFEREKESVMQALETEAGEERGKRLELRVNKKKIIACHSFPVEIAPGEMRNRAGKHPQYLWKRIDSYCIDALSIFNFMLEQDAWVLFRGHDHEPHLTSVSRYPKKGKRYEIEDIGDLKGVREHLGFLRGKIVLDNERRYIINPGRWAGYRRYIIYNRKTREVESRQD